MNAALINSLPYKWRVGVGMGRIEHIRNARWYSFLLFKFADWGFFLANNSRDVFSFQRSLRNTINRVRRDRDQ